MGLPGSAGRVKVKRTKVLLTTSPFNCFYYVTFPLIMDTSRFSLNCKIFINKFS